MSTRWTKITIADIASYQAGAIVNAFQTKAKASGQGDPIPEAISNIVLKIRADIKSGGFDVDSDESKIPAELKPDAVALVVEFAKQRLAGALKMSDGEIRLADSVRTRLDKIAEGKIKPSLPDNPEPAAATTQSSGGCQLVPPAYGTPQRSDYNGL